MRKSDGACRIDAVAVTKIVIEGEGSVAASAVLVGEVEGASMTFGNTVAKSGWPEEVAELASQLREAIEDHLAQVLFEEESYGDDRAPDRRDAVPAGLVESGLGTTDDGTEQL